MDSKILVLIAICSIVVIGGLVVYMDSGSNETPIIEDNESVNTTTDDENESDNETIVFTGGGIGYESSQPNKTK